MEILWNPMKCNHLFLSPALQTAFHVLTCVLFPTTAWKTIINYSSQHKPMDGQENSLWIWSHLLPGKMWSLLYSLIYVCIYIYQFITLPPKLGGSLADRAGPRVYSFPFLWPEMMTQFWEPCLKKKQLSSWRLIGLSFTPGQSSFLHLLGIEKQRFQSARLYTT